MTDRTRPLESSLWRFTLAGMTEGSVIVEVTVTTKGTPAGVEFGLTAVLPIVPADAGLAAMTVRHPKTHNSKIFRIPPSLSKRQTSRTDIHTESSRTATRLVR